MKKQLKKLVLGMFFLLGLFVLVGCSSSSAKDAKKESSSSSKTATTSGSTEVSAYTDPSKLKSDYDVIVVGGGGAGMAAAIQAHDKGVKVAILEKLPVAGGNTSKSSAGMNASETKFQTAQGIKDSNDLFYEETLKGGGGTNDKALLRYFVDNSASAIDWLDSLGIKLDNITITGGMSVKRTHRPSDGSAIGAYLVPKLEENVGKRDIPFFVNADVTKLNEKDGVVNGVQVKIEGKTKTVNAKSVIVTTGGFGASAAMVEKYRPDLKGYVSTNSPGSTGDGIKMITKLGGATVDLDQIQIHPTVIQKNGMLISEALRGEGAIMINKEGKRFYNEMDTRDKVSAAIMKESGKYAYLTFDSALGERAKQVAFYKKEGLLVEGKTIADLAKKIKVDPKILEATYATWNKAVATKKDSEFNRTTGMDNKLDKGPYYAVKIAPGIHHTMGGVKINTLTQVLKKDSKTIPGLYAAGEVTGGLHGNNRIGGNAVTDIIIFGRQAGTQAAANATATK